MLREWLNLSLPADADLTARTLAAAFLCIIPAGCFATVLACCFRLGVF